MSISVTTPPAHGTAVPVSGQDVVVYKSTTGYIGPDSYGYDLYRDGQHTTGTVELDVVDDATYEVHSLVGTGYTPADDNADASAATSFNPLLTSPLGNDGITTPADVVVRVETDDQPVHGWVRVGDNRDSTYGQINYAPLSGDPSATDTFRYSVYRNEGTIDAPEVGVLLFRRTVHVTKAAQAAGIKLTPTTGPDPDKVYFTVDLAGHTSVTDVEFSFMHLDTGAAVGAAVSVDNGTMSVITIEGTLDGNTLAIRSSAFLQDGQWVCQITVNGNNDTTTPRSDTLFSLSRGAKLYLVDNGRLGGGMFGGPQAQNVTLIPLGFADDDVVAVEVQEAQGSTVVGTVKLNPTKLTIPDAATFIDNPFGSELKGDHRISLPAGSGLTSGTAYKISSAKLVDYQGNVKATASGLPLTFTA